MIFYEVIGTFKEIEQVAKLEPGDRTPGFYWNQLDERHEFLESHGPYPTEAEAREAAGL